MKNRGLQTRRLDGLNRFAGRLLMFLGVVTLFFIVFRLLKFILAARQEAPQKANQPQQPSRQPVAEGVPVTASAATTAKEEAPAPEPSRRPKVRRRAQPAKRVQPPHIPAHRASAKRRKDDRRLPWEKVLLAVEAGAVLLFVAAGFTLWQTRTDLNDTYRNLQQTDPSALPTLIAAANPGTVQQAQGADNFLAERPALPTPFPTVTPVAAAIAQANVQEEAAAAREASSDPSALKEDESAEATEEWGTTAVMARLGHESNQPRRLQIPAIGVDSFIFQDYGEDWLKLGVVQIGQAVAPGQPGNVVLAAHNDIYGEIFRDLDELQPGHEIHVLVDQSSFVYRVRETLIVEPDDVWVTLPTSTPTITLVSCYPYLIGNQRIVVFGDLVQ